jgi:hypothetical protein
VFALASFELELELTLGGLQRRLAMKQSQTKAVQLRFTVGIQR